MLCGYREDVYSLTKQGIYVMCGYREQCTVLHWTGGFCVVSLHGGCVQFDTRQRISVLCGYREDVYSLTLDRGFVCSVVTGRMCTV